MPRYVLLASWTFEGGERGQLREQFEGPTVADALDALEEGLPDDHPLQGRAAEVTSIRVRVDRLGP